MVSRFGQLALRQSRAAFSVPRATFQRRAFAASAFAHSDVLAVVCDTWPDIQWTIYGYSG